MKQSYKEVMMSYSKLRVMEKQKLKKVCGWRPLKCGVPGTLCRIFFFLLFRSLYKGKRRQKHDAWKHMSYKFFCIIVWSDMGKIGKSWIWIYFTTPWVYNAQQLDEKGIFMFWEPYEYVFFKRYRVPVRSQSRTELFPYTICLLDYI